MTADELRQKYLDFFKERGHREIPSSSLMPENDPTTLFTSSGMQPLIPYLLGRPHPEGKRLVNSQKCFRAQDIEEVGDNRHTTFFEMLGNWSLGDYFKKEQLTWFWQFLTEELKLPREKLYVSIFKGEGEIPKDEESLEIWKNLGVREDHIFEYGFEKNWWSRFGSPSEMPTFEIGGPDSEVFYEFTQIKHDIKFGERCHPNCDCGRFLEIGNSVFMQYQKAEDGSFKELPKKNVDFGGGLERLLAASLDSPDVFKTDLFWPIIETLCQKLDLDYQSKSNELRVIADHIKAATFLALDGVIPSNKLQGYILRRLIRRAGVKLNLMKKGSITLLPELTQNVLDIYSTTNYFTDKEKILLVLEAEVNKFQATLETGLKEIEKIEEISAKAAFDLYQNFGIPLEVTAEVFAQKGQKIDTEEFKKEFAKHQELSRLSGKSGI